MIRRAFILLIFARYHYIVVLILVDSPLKSNLSPTFTLNLLFGQFETVNIILAVTNIPLFRITLTTLSYIL